MEIDILEQRCTWTVGCYFTGWWETHVSSVLSSIPFTNYLTALSQQCPEASDQISTVLSVAQRIPLG